METKQEKPWIIRSILLAFVVLVFFLNLAVLLFPLAGNYPDYSIFTLVSYPYAGNDRYFPLALEILFFLSIATIGLSILDLVKKTLWGNLVGILYLTLEEAATIAYQATSHELSVSSLVLAILSLILLAVDLGLLFYGKAHEKSLKAPEEEAPKKPSASKGTLIALFAFDILGYLFLFFAILFIPLYHYVAPAGEVSCVFSSVLAGKSTALEQGVYFLFNLLFFLAVSYAFVDTFQGFFTDKEKFAKKSKALWTGLLLLALEFFLMGYIISFVYALKGAKSDSYSFIPFLVLAFLSLPFALLYGKARGKSEETPKRIHTLHESVPLIFAVILTGVSLVSLALNVVEIHLSYNSSSTYSETILVSGLKLLQDYPSLGSGYQALAFVMITMFILSGSLLFLTLASYFARAKAYFSWAKASIYFNALFMTLFGISGFYFSIATDITKESTAKLIATYYPSFSSASTNYTYKISTQTFYLMIADLLLLIVMTALKALEGKKSGYDEENEGSGAVAAPSAMPTPEAPHLGNEPVIADPCPAFGEIDRKIPLFEKDLAERKAQSEKSPSLAGLVHFIVTYARNSRLHLSYSDEDIASFIAGIGACRLSILQGLSGTGKTSLPKILSEAIEGNCELVEVGAPGKTRTNSWATTTNSARSSPRRNSPKPSIKPPSTPRSSTFIVLDEMNLSRIEYYFSDFLSLMENEEGKRSLKLLNVPLFQKTKDGEVPYKVLQGRRND
jgi:hypothetical protein